MSKHTHGDLAHFDITGVDGAQLGAFYHAVFGWEIQSKGPGYASITTPDGSPDGAVVEMENSGITLGIAVDNLDTALSRAKAAGGSVVMPVTDNGWVKKAQIADIDGNIITLIQM